MIMTYRANEKKNASNDYRKYREDTSLLLYEAIPHEKEIICEGPALSNAHYELPHSIHRAVGQIMSDTLTKGKACWQLVITPATNLEVPFYFQPKRRAFQNLETIPIVIRSRNIGISSRCIRSLVKRLKHSEIPLSDLSLLKFNKDREKIANRWGHALSWHMSDPSTFTDPCILLNQCNKKILAIQLCEEIERAMNEALSKSKYADCVIAIPTHSRTTLELSKQLYLEGRIEDKEFSDLVFSRTSIQP